MSLHGSSTAPSLAAGADLTAPRSAHPWRIVRRGAPWKSSVAQRRRNGSAREVSWAELAVAELALDLLEASAGEVGHPEVHEKPCGDVEQPVEPHRGADSDPADEGQQRQGDEEVRAPQSGGLCGRARGPNGEWVGLRSRQPSHELQAAGVEEHEDDEARDDER